MHEPSEPDTMSQRILLVNFYHTLYKEGKMPLLRQRSSRPKRGDHVWLRSRYDLNQQPNGYISGFNWPDKEVHMRFYDGGKETLSLEEFVEGKTWTDKFGGFYFPEGQ